MSNSEKIKPIGLSSYACLNNQLVSQSVENEKDFKNSVATF